MTYLMTSFYIFQTTVNLACRKRRQKCQKPIHFTKFHQANTNNVLITSIQPLNSYFYNFVKETGLSLKFAILSKKVRTSAKIWYVAACKV